MLRHHAHAGHLDRSTAATAHADLLDLPIELWPYPGLADRAWELGGDLTVHDASYVALAGLIEAPLVTLDRSLAGIPDLPCEVLAFQPAGAPQP